MEFNLRGVETANESDDLRRGRALGREAISAALYQPDSPDVGIVPAASEAFRLVLVEKNPDVLLGLVTELWVWSQMAVRVSAGAQGVSIEVAIAQIFDALAHAIPGSPPPPPEASTR